MSVTTENKDKLMVEAIADGTVIDHIAPGQAINILRMFKFLSRNNQLTVGFNLRSGELGKKDIIKIANVVFSPAETEQLAILAPNATINQIDNYRLLINISYVCHASPLVFLLAQIATALPTLKRMQLLALRSQKKAMSL